MCHGQVIGTSMLAFPAKCTFCGTTWGPSYRMTWREGGEARAAIACGLCLRIETERNSRRDPRPQENQ